MPFENSSRSSDGSAFTNAFGLYLSRESVFSYGIQDMLAHESFHVGSRTDAPTGRAGSVCTVTSPSGTVPQLVGRTHLPWPIAKIERSCNPRRWITFSKQIPITLIEVNECKRLFSPIRP